MACRRWYSPIVGGDIAFSNVFCKLCNGFDNDPEALCDAPSPYFGYHFFIEPFTMLINRTMVSDFLNSWTDVEIYKWDGKCGKAMVKHPFKVCTVIYPALLSTHFGKFFFVLPSTLHRRFNVQTFAII